MEEQLKYLDLHITVSFNHLKYEVYLNNI
jgi:hypothetical protein